MVEINPNLSIISQMFVIKPAISQKNVLGWIKKYSPAPCG